jgi:hypothetical protein
MNTLTTILAGSLLLATRSMHASWIKGSGTSRVFPVTVEFPRCGPAMVKLP